VFPVDTSGDDFVKGLEKDTAVFEVFEETLHRWVDVETVEPEGEYSGFTLAFGIKVFDFGFFGFVERVEAGVSVEEICDEGEIQFGVSGDKRGGCEILSTVQFVRILKDL
jgi:hypothetical protein